MSRFLLTDYAEFTYRVQGQNNAAISEAFQVGYVPSRYSGTDGPFSEDQAYWYSVLHVPKFYPVRPPLVRLHTRDTFAAEYQQSSSQKEETCFLVEPFDDNPAQTLKLLPPDHSLHGGRVPLLFRSQFIRVRDEWPNAVRLTFPDDSQPTWGIEEDSLPRGFDNFEMKKPAVRPGFQFYSLNLVDLTLSLLLTQGLQDLMAREASHEPSPRASPDRQEGSPPVLKKRGTSKAKAKAKETAAQAPSTSPAPGGSISTHLLQPAARSDVGSPVMPQSSFGKRPLSPSHQTLASSTSTIKKSKTGPGPSRTHTASSSLLDPSKAASPSKSSSKPAAAKGKASGSTSTSKTGKKREEITILGSDEE